MYSKLKAWALSRPERGLFVGMVVGIIAGTIIDWLW